MTKTKTKELFHVEIEVVWRDYANNFEHKTVKRLFKAESKAEAYTNIKYFNGKWGMVDCIHAGEGWGNTLSKPDFNDPLVKGVIEETTEEVGSILL